MNKANIVKAVIVLVVFPVFVHLIFTVVNLPLRPALAPVLEMAGSWSELLDKGVVVVAFLVAVGVSAAICRRLWPSPTVK